MRALCYLTVGLVMAIGCNGCKPSDSAASPKAPAPAKVPHVAKEETLASVMLTPEAEQRLGIALTPATMKKVTRTRTFGGELLLALGRTSLGTAAGTSASATNQSSSIFSLLPAMTPADMIRVSEMQLDAAGQVAAARVQLQAAQIALKRAEGLLADAR